MLAALIQTIASGQPAYIARRFKRAIAFYAIAAIALCIGLGFLLAAAFLVAAERFGSVNTAVGFAVGFILIAIIVLVIHRIVSGVHARRRAAEARATQWKTLAGATALAMLPTLLKGRGGLLEIAAPVIAMVAYAIYRENTKSELDKDPVE